MIRFRLFGSVELSGRDGGEVASVLSQPKRAALLAYLAAATPRGFHRRDKIVGLFWAESDHERARASLRRSLHFLRQHLGEDVILSRGDEELSLDWDQAWCDVAAFEEALEAGDTAAALELYRGELLEGFFLTGCPEFEKWLDGERERLKERAAGAAWSLAHERIGGGRLTEAERTGQRALALVPTDENEVRRFIEALAAAGDRAAAVRFYEKFAGMLAEELELEPAAETLEVVAQIRAEDQSPAIRRAPRVGLVSARAAESLQPVPYSEEPATGLRRIRAFRRPRIRWAAPATLAEVGILYGIVSFTGREEPFDRLTTRIAVLPPVNLTGDSSLDGLGISAAGWITLGLDALELGRVVDMAEVSFSLESAPEGADPRRFLLATWPTKIGADLAVQGDYFLQGDSLVFGLQVVDREGTLWESVAPARGLRDEQHGILESIRMEAVFAVAKILAPDDLMAQPPGELPRDLSTFQKLMEGVRVYATEGGRAAIPLFLEASELDPGFMAPLRWLVALYWWETPGTLAKADSLCQILEEKKSGFSRQARLVTEMNCAAARGNHRQALDKAVLLLEFSSLYQVRVGFHALDLNLPGRAREAFSRYDPTQGEFAAQFADANSRWLARAYHRLGDFEEELRVAREARSEFPEYRQLVQEEIKALAALGMAEEARPLIDEGLRLLPRGRSPRYFLDDAAREFAEHGYPEVARELWERLLSWYEPRLQGGSMDPGHHREWAETLLHLGRTEEAMESLRWLARENPSRCDDQGRLGVALARLGSRNDAQEIWDVLDAWDDPYALGENRVWQASMAAAAGDKDRAVTLLSRAMDEGRAFRRLSPHLSSPYVQPLRGHPPFEEFREPKG